LQSTLIAEFQLTKADKEEIASLLQRTFPLSEYNGRTYFKQLPHYRLLAKENGKLVGQVGIDYRVMNMAGTLIHVMGAIDLAVDAASRNKGYGKQLMLQLEETAKEIASNVDFLFLVTDMPVFYETLGYTSLLLTTQWLKIHRHKNYGIGNERITDSHFMIKQIGDNWWQGDELDMLGYMY
jgi:predicted N-acetyltransferase YhbS